MPPEPFKILNPLGEDTSIMRTTTLPSMLEILTRNSNYRNQDVKLYEVGRHLPARLTGRIFSNFMRKTLYRFSKTSILVLYYEVVLPSGKVVSAWTTIPGNSILRWRRTQRSIRFSRPSIRHWRKKGYNPINQIVGYILSEDPTYITNYNNARALIRKIEEE